MSCYTVYLKTRILLVTANNRAVRINNSSKLYSLTEMLGKFVIHVLVPQLENTLHIPNPYDWSVRSLRRTKGQFILYVCLLRNQYPDSRCIHVSILTSFIDMYADMLYTCVLQQTAECSNKKKRFSQMFGLHTVVHKECVPTLTNSGDKIYITDIVAETRTQ